MGSAANMQDRMAQMEAMDGAARCLETLRLAVRRIYRNFEVTLKQEIYIFRIKFAVVDL